MKTRFVLLFLAASSGHLSAGTPIEVEDASKSIAVSEPSLPWGGPLVGGGIKSNEAFTEGALFMVYPLLDTDTTIGEDGTMEGTLFYLEPYLTWAEGGDLGASLGLGFRHLFSGESVEDALAGSSSGLFAEGAYIGANLFLDYGHTAWDNDFWQGGVGFEAGTRHLEFRANYYVPFNNYQSIGRVTDTDVTRHHSTSSQSISGSPFVSGSQIVQPVYNQTTTTTRTTTTHATYEWFEEGMEGWDLELALLVPGLDKYCDLRLVGGYYQFTAERSRSDIEGWRAGVEFRPVPAVVLHSTWYESDRLYQDNWMAGVRVELPMENVRDAFRIRRRHLAERLFEPVRRKNSAITTSGVSTREVDWTSSTHTSKTTTTQFAGNQVVGNVPPPPPPMDMEEENEEPE